MSRAMDKDIEDYIDAICELAALKIITADELSDSEYFKRSVPADHTVSQFMIKLMSER
jgi:hypothetical protein